MLKKAKSAAQKGKEKSKKLAKKGAEKTKAFAASTSTKTKSLTKSTTVHTKKLAQKTSIQAKVLTEKSKYKTIEITKKGSLATKDFALKGAAVTKDFTQRGAAATALYSRRLASMTSARVGELSAFLAQDEVLKWTEEISKNIAGRTASVYDKALDAEYIRTHIAGGHHRFFDGGHDVINAWDKVKDALPDDTFTQEVKGYFSALWKDAVTPNGLPLKTLDKESFEVWSEKLVESSSLIKKSYIYDMLSFDVVELFSAGLGAVTLIFCLKRDDQEKLMEILASMGIISILSANPLMGFCVIGLAAYALIVKKTGLKPKALLKGGSVTAVSVTLFATLNTFLLIELTIVIATTIALRKYVFDNEQLLELIKAKAIIAKEKGSSLTLSTIRQLQKIPTKTFRKPVPELPTE